MDVHQRPKRLRNPARITLLLQGKPALTGIMRDAGVAGFHAFVNPLPDPQDPRLSAESISRTTFIALEEIMRDFELEARIHDEASLENLAVRVLRVEPSWEAGFALFVAARFGFMKRETRDRLRQWLSSQDGGGAVQKSTKPEEEMLWPQLHEKGDDIVVTVPARYYLIPHLREMCGRLAHDAGLDDLASYQVMVAADEVITNAFKHGSPMYGTSKIQIRVHIDRRGFWLYVRDEGGIPFDVEGYRNKDVRRPEAGHRGIHLVSRFTDSWDVTTQPGKSTEFSFFKAREHDDGRAPGQVEPAVRKEPS